jgi:hypothetical protein
MSDNKKKKQVSLVSFLKKDIKFSRYDTVTEQLEYSAECTALGEFVYKCIMF